MIDFIRNWFGRRRILLVVTELGEDGQWRWTAYHRNSMHERTEYCTGPVRGFQTRELALRHFTRTKALLRCHTNTEIKR